ncbi:MAG: type 1 glutamine amidotransferase [Rhizobiaceae bacterium]
MHILVLQHADVEHPGILRKFLDEDGHRMTQVELDHGESIPDIDGFDALWVMGGPMDVWQEDEHPWLKGEKEFIREAVMDKGVPFLGLCLGHQLLAEALGGTVGPSDTPEIGIMPVNQTELGAESIFFDGAPGEIECLQWHSAEVKSLPPDVKVLATSPACVVQAMSWGPRAFSAQFHVEVEADTVANWAAIPEYESALIKAMGEGAVTRLERGVADRLDQFNTVAERLYINWLQATATV